MFSTQIIDQSGPRDARPVHVAMDLDGVFLHGPRQERRKLARWFGEEGAWRHPVYVNQPIPDSISPTNFVAAFWDDLNPNFGGTVYRYERAGTLHGMLRVRSFTQDAYGIPPDQVVGTLDPFATGLLVIGIGPATRLMRFLSSGHKSYEATVRFGAETDSEDLTGWVVGVAVAVAHIVSEVGSERV